MDGVTESHDNDLEKAIRRTLTVAKPFVGVIAAALVVLGVTWAVYSFADMSKRKKHATAWNEYFKAERPEDFEALVRNYDGTPAAIHATMQVAMRQLLDGQRKLSAAERSEGVELIDKAAVSFRKIMDDASAPDGLRMQASYWLAFGSEYKGAFSEAIEQYRRCADSWKTTGFGAMAERRIKLLEDPAAREFYQKFTDYRPEKDGISDLLKDSGLPGDIPPPPSTATLESAPKDPPNPATLTKPTDPKMPEAKPADPKDAKPASKDGKPAEAKAPETKPAEPKTPPESKPAAPAAPKAPESKPAEPKKN